jgi:hypothetical protein
MIAEFATVLKPSTTSPMRPNQPEEILSDEKVAPHSPAKKDKAAG